MLSRHGISRETLWSGGSQILSASNFSTAGMLLYQQECGDGLGWKAKGFAYLKGDGAAFL